MVLAISNNLKPIIPIGKNKLCKAFEPNWKIRL
jgi:hypothetical protein